MDGERAKRNRGQDLQSLGEQSVDDVGTRFDGKWVLMRVTEYDQYHSPSRGVVVAVTKTRNDIQPAALEAVEDAKQKGTHYYLFKAFRRVRSGSEWAETLDRIARLEGRGGARRQDNDNG